MKPMEFCFHTDGVLTEFPLDELVDSRLEFISDDRSDSSALEEALLACVATRTQNRIVGGRGGDDGHG